LRVIDLNSTRASEVIGKIDTLLLPVGTLEAHGPHCSVAADALIADKMAVEVERMAPDRVLLGPLIPYGHTWHLKAHPGSLDVAGKALADYVFEVIKGFGETWKIKNAVIVNGHGGNIDPLHEAAERASDLGIKTVILSWWTGGFLEPFKQVVGDSEGHAGEAETSLLLNVGEKYVEKGLVPREDHNFSFPTAATFMDIYDSVANRAAFPRAFSGKPRDASTEKGKRLNQIAAEVILKVIDGMKSGKLIV
jgi:creatinine amidohydrolase